ncbi:MAG: phage head morphogenesis protein [gamma proteobacterium symbiont of Taylorina sp.]|nr:phage head morphogenesis protein [gamma proteobacterium symbiont of Taylorina sp.]
MNANEKLIDAITIHLVDLTRVEPSIKNDVLAKLKALEKEIIMAIVDANLEVPINPAAKKKVLNNLLKTAQKIIESHYSQISQDMIKVQEDIVKTEFKFVENSINIAIGATIANTVINKKAATTIAKETLIEGAPSKDWWGRQSVGLHRSFIDLVRRGVLAGDTNQQIIQRIKGTRGRGFTDGVMNIPRKNATTLITTAIHAVANRATMKAYEGNEDISKGYRHLSTMDNKTSTICQAKSDLIWTSDKKPVNHNILFEVPPIHWNCRSKVVLIIKDWDEITGKTKTKLEDKLTPRQRAVMGGQAKVANYEDWLKTKPKVMQIEKLGQKKWDLWQTGKLSFRDMIDQRGNPLSIEELYKKLGVPLDNVV